MNYSNYEVRLSFEELPQMQVSEKTEVRVDTCMGKMTSRSL